MLADSSPSNLQLITKELLSMHHQCDPALTKEFDVSKKPFFNLRDSISTVWSIELLHSRNFHGLQFKITKSRQVNEDPVDLSEKQILLWVFVNYLHKKEVLLNYHQFHLDMFQAAFSVLWWILTVEMSKYSSCDISELIFLVFCKIVHNSSL